MACKYLGMVDAALGKILVVEDDDTERESAAELLCLWGYEAKTACDGLQALQEISLASFDLVISDLRMPRMSGIELLKELGHQLHSVSCIIMSGEGSWCEEIEAIRLGAYSFLEKPVDPDRLRAEVRDCLAARINIDRDRSPASALRPGLPAPL
ncbi:MAG: response regulator [Terriglobia bacterium]